MSSEILQRFQTREPARLQEVRVVWRSPLIANDPLAWRKDLPEALKAKLRAFWLGYGESAAQKEKLKPLLAGGFRASSDRQLIPYRQLDLFRERAKIEADASLADGQKQEKLAALTRRLDALDRQLAAAAN